MKSDRQRKKKEAKEKEEIIRGLPPFISQLLILLGSGMMVEEAFCRIVEGYRKGPEWDKNSFLTNMWEIKDCHEKTGEKISSLILAYSRRSGVRQFNQVATIIAENMERGTFLWERLAQLGDELWEERKRNGMEKIRLAESKMSFPLGLLLLSLLIITAAPALMQM